MCHLVGTPWDIMLNANKLISMVLFMLKLLLKINFFGKFYGQNVDFQLIGPCEIKLNV